MKYGHVLCHRVDMRVEIVRADPRFDGLHELDVARFLAQPVLQLLETSATERMIPGPLRLVEGPAGCADGVADVLSIGICHTSDDVRIGRIDHIEAFPASCLPELAVDEQQCVVQPIHVAPLRCSATPFQLEYSYLTISTLARTWASEVVRKLSEQG